MTLACGLALVLVLRMVAGQTIDAYTCGFTSGDVNSPITCATTSLKPGDPTPGCVYYATDQPNFGCCAGNGVCSVAGCLNYKQAGNVNSGGDAAVFGTQFLCGSAAPSCTTVLLIGSTLENGQQQTYSSYGCDLGSALFLAYETPFTTSSATSSSTMLTSPRPGTPASTPVMASATSATSTAALLAASSASKGGKNSSADLPAGAEVGISVGVSLGVIAALALAGFAFWHRRKTRTSSTSKNEHIPDSSSHSNDESNAYPTQPPGYVHDAKRAAEMMGTSAAAELPGVRPVYEMGGDTNY